MGNSELRSHIRKLQTRATLSLICVLLIVVSLVFGIGFAVVRSWAAVPCFGAALISVAYLLFADRAARREERQGGFEPVAFRADREWSFQNVTAFFEGITVAEKQVVTSENVRFYLTDHIFKLRAVVYGADAFDKKAFDSARDRINKKANKALNISPWVSLGEAVNMMRFNIICADELNDELHRFLSQNACRNLTRAEGIVNMAIVGDRILIPPLYGRCDPVEIRRYKGVVGFVEQAFLS